MDNWAQIRVLRAEEGDWLCGSAIRFLVLFSDIGRPSWLSFPPFGLQGWIGPGFYNSVFSLFCFKSHHSFGPAWFRFKSGVVRECWSVCIEVARSLGRGILSIR